MVGVTLGGYYLGGGGPDGGGMAQAFGAGVTAAQQEELNRQSALTNEQARREREQLMRMRELETGWKVQDRARVEAAWGGAPVPMGAAPAAPAAPANGALMPRLDVPTTATGAPASLVRTESGGNWAAKNEVMGAGGMPGHFGRLQFGQARLQEAQAAGAMPVGMTPQEFLRNPDIQQSVERWHFADINQFIQGQNLGAAVGQTIKGVPVTINGMIAVAHLGGKQGLKRFIETGGQYDPADANGTRLSDYLRTHGGFQPAGMAVPSFAAAPAFGRGAVAPAGAPVVGGIGIMPGVPYMAGVPAPAAMAAPAPTPSGIAPVAEVPGVTQVDPRATAFMQDVQGLVRSGDIEGAINRITNGLAAGQYGMPAASPAGRAASSVYQYFTATPEERAAAGAERDRAAQVLSWYQSPDVKELLRTNPILLTRAAQDPVAVFEANKTTVGPTAVGAAPAAPAAPAAAPVAQAPAAPIVVEGADGAPISINVTPQAAPTLAPTAAPAPEAGVRQPGTSLTQNIMAAPAGGTPAPVNLDRYLLEPATVGVERQRLEQQRQLLQQQYARARGLRDVAAVTAIEEKLNAINAGTILLDGMDAITSLNAGDAGPLANTLNRLSGGRLRLQPRSDGKYNVYDGERLTREGVTQTELSGQARMIFDQNYQAQVKAAITREQERAAKFFEAQVEGLKEAYKQQSTMTREMAVKQLEDRLKAVRPDITAIADPQQRGVFLYDKNNNAPVGFVTIEQEVGPGNKPVTNPDGSAKFTVGRVQDVTPR